MIWHSRQQEMKHAQSSTKYVVNLVAAFNGAGEHLKPTADAFQTTVAFCDDGAFQWQTEEVDMDRNLRKVLWLYPAALEGKLMPRFRHLASV